MFSENISPTRFSVDISAACHSLYFEMMGFVLKDPYIHPAFTEL